MADHEFMAEYEQEMSLGPDAVRDDPATLDVNGGIATLSLNRPDRSNALDVNVAARLAEHAERIVQDDGFHVIVIQGRGPAFCVGGDLFFLASRRDDLPSTIRELLGFYHRFLVALRTTPKIVITKLHGAVAGAGLSLAFMGDVAVAAEDARFVPGYAKLGISPDGGGTVGLVDKIGPGRALQLLLATDRLSAADAKSWGLVDEVAPATELDGRVAELAGRFALVGSAGIAATKRLVARTDEEALRVRLHAEQEALIECMATDTFAAALAKFTHGR